MKKHLLLLCLASMGFLRMAAQLPDGTIAPDWTETSITGQTFHLYDMLNAGKVVYIDFSATWCGPCWNYHNTHALRDVYDAHGPAGDNKARVFFIEGDNSTNVQCLYGPTGCIGGTQGNWVAGTTYPIIDDANENTTSAYQIGYFPTIYGICPMNKLVYETGQLSADGLWAWQANTCPLFQITSAPVVTNVLCFGQNNGKIVQTPTNGIGPYTYIWSTGAITKDILNLAPNNYYVTITDSNGSTGVVGPVTVEGPTVPLSANTIETTPVGCAGIMGSIFIEAAGGTSDYSYAWQNGQTGQQAIGLTAGLWKCTVTDDNNCTYVYQHTLAPAVYPTAAIATPGMITCANSTVILNGGASSQGPEFSYQWQATGGGNIVSGATTLNPVVNASGTYILQVTNGDNNCFTTAVTAVGANNTLPTANAGANGTVTCASPATNLTGTGSSGANFSYLWTATNGGNITSGSTTLSPNVNAAGTYTLVVTNAANGCTAASAASVTGNNQPPSLAVSGGILNCSATQITLGATSNGQSLSWAWTGPNGFTSSAQNPAVNVGGNYSVVINSAATGCTNTATAAVATDLAVPAVSATGGAITCLANSVILSSTSSATNSTFNWAGPNGFTSNLQNPTAAATGSYSLIVTAPNGCTGASAATIALNTTLPTSEAGNNGTLNCNASQVNLSGIASSQGSNFTYNWTTANGNILSGGNTLTPTVNAAGTYNLQVTNSDNGCTSTDLASVSVNSAPVAAISNPLNISCFNGNNGSAYVFPTGGAGSFTYAWSNGMNTNNIASVSAGAYSVTVTDSDNCTATTSVTLTQPNLLAPNATATAQLQNGQNDGTATANPAGGTSGYNYLWTNGGTSQTISGLAPGSYSVVVTDANGCTATQTVTVNALGCAIAATAGQQNVLCFGQNNGSATVNLTGANNPVTFAWSNGQTGQTATNLTAGLYSVNVTDANGCPASLSFNIGEPTALASNATATGETSQGGNDGTATANPTGGTGPFTYLWSNSFASQTIVGLTPGLYTVAVTDGNGCVSNQTVVVGSFNCALQPTLANSAVSCFGGNNGLATISLGGGIAPYIYVWSNGQTTATASNLAAGQYSVVVTDANGCQTTETATVSQPAALDVSAVQINMLCPADAVGEIALTTTGGTSGYTYLWSNGATTSTVSGLTVGNYSAIITDANGCSTTKSAAIASTDIDAPNLVLKNIIVPIDDNGVAQISPAAFNDGSTDNCAIATWSASQSSFDCSQLGVHVVTILATDGSGNISQKTAEVTVVDTKAPVLTCPSSQTTSFCKATVNYQYPIAVDNCINLGGQWNQSSGLASGSEFPLGATTNTFSYTDASGNAGTCSFEIVVLAAPTLDLTVQNQVSCFGGNDGSATIATTGGNAPFTYLWSNGQTSATATNLAAGQYSVDVIDAAGCAVSSQNINVGQPEAISLTVDNVQNDVNNAGIGSIDISVGGGSPGYVYSWTKDGAVFSDKQDLTALFAGTYVCVITDANGCFVKTQTIIITNSVGTDEPTWAKGLLLSPNPTTGEVQIVFKTMPEGAFSVKLFDANGQLVSLTEFDSQVSAISLDYSAVPAGIYIITIGGDKSVANRRLIIAH